MLATFNADASPFETYEALYSHEPGLNMDPLQIACPDRTPPIGASIILFQRLIVQLSTSTQVSGSGIQGVIADESNIELPEQPVNNASTESFHVTLLVSASLHIKRCATGRWWTNTREQTLVWAFIFRRWAPALIAMQTSTEQLFCAYVPQRFVCIARAARPACVERSSSHRCCERGPRGCCPGAHVCDGARARARRGLARGQTGAG